MRSKKCKLFLSLIALIFSLGVMCFGVYSVASVQYTISGNVYYEVPTPPVRITKITSGSTILSTSSITLELGKPYPLDYSLEIQPNSTYVDPEHPQGQRTEIFLQMSSNISNYARMFINYDSTTNSDVKVNASSLYLKSSGIYKIYIDNNSSSAVNLNTLGITIQYDEKESILQYDETNKYFYVEMGTLMRDNATQNEYIKWRLIGTQTDKATSTSASQYERFDGTSAPSTGTKGVFILETNTLLKRDDGTNSSLNEVAFNHSYSTSTNKHTEEGWTDILANDYATSTVRQYINGNNVYKASSSITGGYGPDMSSHYSNMYTDFCIDTENDIVYKAITGRTLKDLYLENGGGSSNSGKPVYFPEQLTTLNKEGYTSSTADKFWLLSYKEVDALLSYTGWPSDRRNNYWVRSPYLAAFYAFGVGYTNHVFSYVYSGNFAARAAFTMPL